MANKQKAGASTRESGAAEFVPVEVAINRIIGELTEMRVRQRALLETLQAGAFSWSNYVDCVRKVRKRDFDALFGAMIYHPEAFMERFKEWVKEDTQRYLYDTKSMVEIPPARPPRSKPQKRVEPHTATAKRKSPRRR